MNVSDLTPYQYDKICNGCGSSKTWIRPPKARFFRKPCDNHDLGYYLGYNETHRKEDDTKLKQEMFCLVNYKFHKKGIKNWLNRRRYYTWCRLYYHGVRWQGYKHFYYSDKPQKLPHFPHEQNVKR